MLFYQFVPILFLWICTVILTRSELSPYNKCYCCNKSVTIKNKKLSKIVIAKKHHSVVEKSVNLKRINFQSLH